MDDTGNEVDTTGPLARMWRQLYNNLLREGFNEAEALQLLKTFILSVRSTREA